MALRKEAFKQTAMNGISNDSCEEEDSKGFDKDDLAHMQVLPTRGGIICS